MNIIQFITITLFVGGGGSLSFYGAPRSEGSSRTQRGHGNLRHAALIDAAGWLHHGLFGIGDVFFWKPWPIEIDALPIGWGPPSGVCWFINHDNPHEN